MLIWGVLVFAYKEALNVVEMPFCQAMECI
jgi:hypothetical protein